jgi:MYXO-CTERM domain-containing protein
MLAAQAHAVVTVQVGTVSAQAGTTAELPVTLSTGGDDVAGTENVITFDSDAPIAARANGRPDCTVNPDIDKTATAFAYQPPGCTAGTDCTAVKAVVLSTANVDPIPDGSVLYTCNVAVAAGATGELLETCSEPGASDPEGQSLDSACSGGGITIGGGGPTATPTQGEEALVRIVVGDAQGEVNTEVMVDVTLEVPGVGTEVAGTENVIRFSGGPGAQIRIKALANGRPDCAVNPAIDKTATAFAFQPAGCTGEACVAMKAVVLSTANVDPIPPDSVLYTCTVEITSTASDGEMIPLTCEDPGASTPDGMSLPTDCVDGTITVGTPVVPTPTPTPGAGGTPTNTVPGGATATRTGGVIPPTPFCDDGCAISAQAENQSGWWLLLPAAALLWLRRRSR